jgi:hypothetical protein
LLRCNDFRLWPVFTVSGPGRARQLCPGTSDLDLLCDLDGLVTNASIAILVTSSRKGLGHYVLRLVCAPSGRSMPWEQFAELCRDWRRRGVAVASRSSFFSAGRPPVLTMCANPGAPAEKNIFGNSRLCPTLSCPVMHCPTISYIRRSLTLQRRAAIWIDSRNFVEGLGL